MCVDGASHSVGNHGIMHTFQSYAAINSPLGRLYLENGTIFPPPPEPEIHVTTYGAAKQSAAKALIDTFPDSGCDQACIIKQLDAYHHQQGITDETVIKAVHTRNVTEGDLDEAHAMVTQRVDNEAQGIAVKRSSR